MVRARRVPSRRRAAKKRLSPRAIPTTPLRASSSRPRIGSCQAWLKTKGSCSATASRFLSRLSCTADREVGSRRQSRLARVQQRAARRAAVVGTGAATADRGKDSRE
jgi:hypothetical protein